VNEAYYVFEDVTDPTCQPWEAPSYEEAREEVVRLQKAGCPNARIAGGHIGWDVLHAD
jgi:hypothetical protein